MLVSMVARRTVGALTASRSPFRCQSTQRVAWTVSSRGLASAVKELSWCTPTHLRRRLPREGTKDSRKMDDSQQKEMIPIDKFGIIAATSRNHVIGVNGKLPWKLPDDRAYFKDLTRGKILILGRRTLDEDPKLRHVSHASNVIVLSRSMAEADLAAMIESQHVDLTNLSLTTARSFPEALHTARCLVRDHKNDAGGVMEEEGTNHLDCWVVGGERVYHEALIHPSADALHLTVVDVDVDERSVPNASIARFPAKYRWDNKFKLAWSSQKSDSATGMAYRIDVFKRLKGRR